MNQQKIREAKLIAAKKAKEAKAAKAKEIGGLYERLDSIHEAINKPQDTSDLAKAEKLDELNNIIVKLMNELLAKDIKVEIPDTVSVSNLKDIKIPQTKLTIPDEVKVNNLEWLASDASIKEVSEKLANIADQLGELKPEYPGQRPEDFVPFRRVYMNGNRLVFDDSAWSKGGGGGATFDKSGLATEAKQDDIITAVDGIKSKPTDAYSIQAISDDGTYKYFFFEDASANWYILRKTLATSLFIYTKGTGGYASVYVDENSGPSGSPTWASYGTTF